MGPFWDPPKRRPRDDRSGGPGSESRERHDPNPKVNDEENDGEHDTRPSTTTTPTTTLQDLVKKDARRREIGSGSPKPTSGHRELPHKRPRKTSRQQTTQRSELQEREILNGPLDTEISSATLEHEEKEESRDRRRHATTQTRSALRTKTMQNQWFFKGPIHVSNSKVPSKDQWCPEVK